VAVVDVGEEIAYEVRPLGILGEQVRAVGVRARVSITAATAGGPLRCQGCMGMAGMSYLNKRRSSWSSARRAAVSAVAAPVVGTSGEAVMKRKAGFDLWALYVA
jgi:hypothetical protein